MTGKIERWHQTLKNPMLLENYDLRGALEQAVGALVERYNHARNHESLGNFKSADVCFGKDEAIIRQKRQIN